MNFELVALPGSSRTAKTAASSGSWLSRQDRRRRGGLRSLPTACTHGARFGREKVECSYGRGRDRVRPSLRLGRPTGGRRIRGASMLS